MRPVLRLGRSERWWLGLGCGATAVVMAVTVLKIGASAAPAVEIHGSAPPTSAARTYDILVSACSSGESATANGGSANPAELSNVVGGITVAQYDKIRGLPGVAVAAPLTMVGYLPYTVSVPVNLPVPAKSRPSGPLTVTVRLVSDNGLSAVTYDDVITTHQNGPAAGRSATVPVQFSWTFQLPLIAVDPIEEAKLVHLDSSVTSGRYLPETAVSGSQPVPLLLAGSITDYEQAEIGVPGTATTLATVGAYQQLVAGAAGRAMPVPEYWTAEPVRYQLAADGDLLPQSATSELAAAWQGPYMWTGAPAGMGMTDVSFRSVSQHSARGADGAVQAVGVFDPAKVAGATATPSPYRPDLLTGADANSRKLLGDRPLAAPADPGGLPGSAAALVMPLAELSSFTSRYAAASLAAPIGIVRVRVAGAAGDSAASVARIRAAAQEIVHATGLRVSLTLGATDVKRVIDLPAGLHGRPPLRVYQDWYGTGLSTVVRTGPGIDILVLSGLGLLAGETVIFWNTWQTFTGRKRERMTLRVLGWSRNALASQLFMEFLPTIAVTLGAAWLTVNGTGSAPGSGLGWAWLLSIPAAVTLLAAGSRRSPRSSLRSSSPAGRVGRLLRTPSRVPLRAFVVAVASAAVAVEVAALLTRDGPASALVGGQTGWTGTVAAAAAVLLIVALATLILADLGRVGGRERAAEVSTLRAIGWPAAELARRALWSAMWPGLLGALGAATAVSFGLSVDGEVAPGALVVSGLVAVLCGFVLDLVGVSLGMFGRQQANTEKLTVHQWFARWFRMLIRPDD